MRVSEGEPYVSAMPEERWETRSRSMFVTLALARARANASIGVWCREPLVIQQELFGAVP